MQEERSVLANKPCLRYCTPQHAPSRSTATPSTQEAHCCSAALESNSSAEPTLATVTNTGTPCACTKVLSAKSPITSKSSSNPDSPGIASVRGMRVHCSATCAAILHASRGLPSILRINRSTCTTQQNFPFNILNCFKSSALLPTNIPSKCSAIEELVACTDFSSVYIAHDGEISTFTAKYPELGADGSVSAISNFTEQIMSTSESILTLDEPFT
mmetsp:Transcript_14094/g.24825  ORF Transcript_14094/g.24825 Transcript_14094/m.24825 type:complete len:215 (+) Transcript_14094:196-840(+)